jgi:hypothetical protein
MPKPRGKEHTTLTETASLVVRELKALPGIKMIAPGMIKTSTKRKSGVRFVTCVYTSGGMELIVSGQSVQKVAVHTDSPTESKLIFKTLTKSKRLKDFEFKEREKNPGI